MQLKRILVPLAGTSVDVEVIRVAVALGKPAKAEIVAIHVIEVRWNLPLDAKLVKDKDGKEPSRTKYDFKAHAGGSKAPCSIW